MRFGECCGGRLYLEAGSVRQAIKDRLRQTKEQIFTSGREQSSRNKVSSKHARAMQRGQYGMKAASVEMFTRKVEKLWKIDMRRKAGHNILALSWGGLRGSSMSRSGKKQDGGSQP